jgi:hypothetical protein
MPPPLPTQQDNTQALAYNYNYTKNISKVAK